jgi:hypothetical protein
MPGHLSDDRLIEALDKHGPRDERSRRHLEGCEACGAQVRELAQTLRLASDADIPEPSPLYWEAFRQQIGRRLDEEPRSFAGKRFWIPGLTAVAAASLVIASLVPWSQTLTSRAPAAHLPAWSALPEEDDTALAVLQRLSPSDEEVDSLAGAGGVADRLADLSDDESRSLADALRGEWEGRKL